MNASSNFVLNENANSRPIVFPCSAIQRQLWLASNLDPENLAYNIPLAIVLEGAVDISHLTTALEILVRRHESLRTTFHWNDGALEQHVHDDYRFNIAVEHEGTHSDAGTILNSALQHRFLLDRTPGFYVRLLKMREHEYLLAFVFHHVIVDHQAVLIFQQELAETYERLLMGEFREETENAIQYGDYVIWKRDNYSADRRETALSFWRDHLHGQSGFLNLPLDMERQAEHRGTAKEFNYSLSESTSSAFAGFVRESNSTHFIVLLASLKLLLFRYCDQPDIIVASPFTDRIDFPELEHVVGCFMSMLPLPSKVDTRESFSSIVKDQMRTFRQAIDHSSVSLEDLVSYIPAPRTSGIHALFQAGFTFQEPPAAPRFKQLRATPISLHTGWAMYDLHIWMWQENGKISGSVWYADEVMTEAFIALMMKNFEALLSCLIADASAPVQSAMWAITFSSDDPNQPKQLHPDAEPCTHPVHSKRFWKSYLNREWPTLALPLEQTITSTDSDTTLNAQIVEIAQDIVNQLDAIAFNNDIQQDSLYAALVLMTLHRFTLTEEFGVMMRYISSSEPDANLIQFPCHVSGMPGIEALEWVKKTASNLRLLLRHSAIGWQEIIKPLAMPDNSVSIEVRDRRYDSLMSRSGTVELDEPNATILRIVLELSSSGDIRVVFYYQRNRLHEEQVMSLANTLVSLATAFVESPRASVFSLNLFKATDKKRYCSIASGPVLELPERHVVELLRKGFQDGQRIAVRDEAVHLSYDALWQKSFAVATQLRRIVTQGSVVGVYMDRSAYSVVALLGIMQAGACYLPLDPDNPKERLQTILEEANCTTCIVDSAHRQDLNSTGMKLLDIGEMVHVNAISQEIDWEISPASSAYLIFTSGSTGRPKGVEVPHVALINFLKSMRERPGMSKETRLLATTTVSFDISMLELLLPLYCGGEVIVANRRHVTDPVLLAQTLQRFDINYLQATPTGWQMLLASGWQGKSDLNALVGGEALSSDVMRRLRGCVGKLFNMYGPTETTVWSTVNEITEEAYADCIGSAIHNTSLYVLTPDLAEQPIGAVGELCIGGQGVSRGYWGRSDLTDSSFITLHNRDRIYRTGDLVRMEPDRSLRYLGRIDSQVKVRGYRVELSEIEGRLRSYPEVINAAALVMREEGASDLIAYVVMPSKPFSEQSLKSYLAQSLPAYMVPQKISLIDEIPLTSSGKADRRALIKHAQSNQDDENLTEEAETGVGIRSIRGIENAFVLVDQHKRIRTVFFQRSINAPIDNVSVRKEARTFLSKEAFSDRFIEVKNWPQVADSKEMIRYFTEFSIDGPAQLTETEQVVSKIWGAVLNRKNIKKSDHFFDLGGQSVTAVHVILEIRNLLGVDISQDKLLINSLQGVSKFCDEQRSRKAVESVKATDVVHEVENERSPILGNRFIKWLGKRK